MSLRTGQGQGLTSLELTLTQSGDGGSNPNPNRMSDAVEESRSNAVYIGLHRDCICMIFNRILKRTNPNAKQ